MDRRRDDRRDLPPAKGKSYAPAKGKGNGYHHGGAGVVLTPRGGGDKNGVVLTPRGGKNNYTYSKGSGKSNYKGGGGKSNYNKGFGGKNKNNYQGGGGGLVLKPGPRGRAEGVAPTVINSWRPRTSHQQLGDRGENRSPLRLDYFDDRDGPPVSGGASPESGPRSRSKLARPRPRSSQKQHLALPGTEQELLQPRSWTTNSVGDPRLSSGPSRFDYAPEPEEKLVLQRRSLEPLEKRTKEYQRGRSSGSPARKNEALSSSSVSGELGGGGSDLVGGRRARASGEGSWEQVSGQLGTRASEKGPERADRPRTSVVSGELGARGGGEQVSGELGTRASEKGPLVERADRPRTSFRSVLSSSNEGPAALRRGPGVSASASQISRDVSARPVSRGISRDVSARPISRGISRGVSARPLSHGVSAGTISSHGVSASASQRHSTATVESHDSSRRQHSGRTSSSSSSSAVLGGKRSSAGAERERRRSRRSPEDGLTPRSGGMRGAPPLTWGA